MRTAQRDQGGTATLSGVVVDAASGTGVMQPGSVPFTFTRTATGVYLQRFDSRLQAVAVTVISTGAGWVGQATNVGAGLFQANFQNNVWAFTSTNFSFFVTVLDKRT